MGLPILIYYASVVRGSTILVEYKNGRKDMAPVASDCLKKIPSLHSRFTYTKKRRIFICLNEFGFTFAAIIDESLGKTEGFSYLEQARDEFKHLLQKNGLTETEGGLLHIPPTVYKDFHLVLKELSQPLVGVPQKEIDGLRRGVDPDILSAEFSRSPSEADPLVRDPVHSDGHVSVEKGPSTIWPCPSLSRGKSSKAEKRAESPIRIKESSAIQSPQRIEVVVQSPTRVKKTESFKLRAAKAQEANALWWRKLKIILALDVCIVLLLFFIWIGICKGFQCVQ